MHPTLGPTIVERIRLRINNSMPFDILNSSSGHSVIMEEVSHQRFLLSLLAKGLLRPPLLLALYMLDIDHFEVYDVPPEAYYEEENNNNQTGFPPFNQAGGTVAMAALHTWAIDLMDSVSCWL